MRNDVIRLLSERRRFAEGGTTTLDASKMRQQLLTISSFSLKDEFNKKNADKRSLRSFPLVWWHKKKNENFCLLFFQFFFRLKLDASCHQCHSNAAVVIILIHPWCLYKRDVRFSFHSHFLSFSSCNHKKGLKEQYAELGIAKHRQAAAADNLNFFQSRIFH